jgi:hypothetical protein
VQTERIYRFRWNLRCGDICSDQLHRDICDW